MAGISEAKNFKGKYEAKLEFLKKLQGSNLNTILGWGEGGGGEWILSGTAQ